MRYRLEIYEPGSQETIIAAYVADVPFMPIHSGNLIRVDAAHGRPGDRARSHIEAIVIEHRFTKVDGMLTQTVCVYTESVRDDWNPLV